MSSLTQQVLELINQQNEIENKLDQYINMQIEILKEIKIINQKLELWAPPPKVVSELELILVKKKCRRP